ncbi:MAG: 3-hydroxyacyl-CoA dehydrogenase/enoyl-CoA hydratase family protein [Alphaproteobacteria bacterium]
MFKKIGVLGSGVMGMGIAAHCANAGLDVVLLDMKAPDGTNVSDSALKRALKQSPAPFMHKKNAKKILTGNLDDDLNLLKDCDWVVEVIIENLAIKQDLYKRLQAELGSNTILTSNTSTIPLKLLTDKMDEALKSRFAITHFFNPPRYMRLLELVKGPNTQSEVVEKLRSFCDQVLGKGVVECKDSPAFIANRIGQFWTGKAIRAAFDRGLTVEEADAINGKPFGIPKTGVFALMDLVGLDLIPLIDKSMRATLPSDDPYLNIGSAPMIEEMIEAGYTGRKGKGGFYLMEKSPNGKRTKLSKSLRTGEYSPSVQASMSSISAGRKGPRELIEAGDEGSAYAWEVFSGVICYAAELADQIAYSTQSIDEAMEWGYAWKDGPFKLLDSMGVDWFVERLQAEGRSVPALLSKAQVAGSMYSVNSASGRRQIMSFEGVHADVTVPDGVILLDEIKRVSNPVKKNASAALWDLGDGCLAFEFTSKANALDNDIMVLIKQTVKLIEKEEQYKALVIYNDGANFSVGANLGLVIFAINMAMWPVMESMMKEGQDAYMALRFAKFPVVAAPFGYAFGGGCEVCLHADAVQASAETYTGLVEAGVGVIPGWGGCKEMIRRHYTSSRMPKGPMPSVAKAFEYISTAKVATSAQEAKEMMILNEKSGITFNRSRLLADAKARALGMVEGYEPPEPDVFRLPGASGRAALEMAVMDFHAKGFATDYDVELAGHLANILTGGETDVVDEVTEQDLLDLERKAFLTLAKKTKTQDRITHMLETNKPLRN